MFLYFFCFLTGVAFFAQVVALSGLDFLYHSLAVDYNIKPKNARQYEYNMHKLNTVMLVVVVMTFVAFVWSLILVLAELFPWINALVY